MKHGCFAILLLAGFLGAVPASADSLDCRTLKRVMRENGPRSWYQAADALIRVKAATVSSSEELLGVRISEAYATPAPVDLVADEKFAPKTGLYRDMNRFGPATSSTCRFYLVLPKDLRRDWTSADFRGYLHMACVGWDRYLAFELLCALK